MISIRNDFDNVEKRPFHYNTTKNKNAKKNVQQNLQEQVRKEENQILT